ncbi:MAG: hypothetical protein U9O20_04735 [Patescibacteria group bacterium]|nr:hypothetical protein [Patescibacteria group bacterium]
MFNPFLIVYFVFLTIFLAGVFAVIYHLQVYKFNEKISLLVTSLFIVGSLILLAVNIVIAIEIDWTEFLIIF